MERVTFKPKPVERQRLFGRDVLRLAVTRAVRPVLLMITRG